jgi:hypothetical protein
MTHAPAPPGETGGPKAYLAHERLSPVLQGWANQMAARFGAPVYLVGSSLTEVQPRDVDIVIILPLDDFVARYGNSPDWKWHTLEPGWDDGSLRWAADVAKLGAFCSRVHKLNVDLKITPPVDWHKGKPRLRLDRVAEIPDAPGGEPCSE